MASTKDAREGQEEEVLEFIRGYAQNEFQHDEKMRNRRASIGVARDHLFMDQFQGAAKKIFKNKIVVPKYVPSERTPKDRILNLLLSDLHFGAMLDAQEVPIQYGHVEEARRIAAVARQAADYKRQYRDHTVLHVNLLGDIIQGQLHDARDGAPLAEQMSAAIYLLSQTIGFLASQFPKVVVYCTPGNHGRNMLRHRERATNQKWDSLENVIYFSLKTVMADVDNVEFVIPYTPYFVSECFGSRGFFTHGDTVIKPGYPGKTINIENIRKQVNEWNVAAMQKGEKYDLFAVGHVHVGSCTEIPSGPTLITNGCLIPTDAYALSIGAPGVKCGQYLWESVKGHIVGDVRFLNVNEDTDKDASLDRIIKPYQGQSSVRPKFKKR